MPKSHSIGLTMLLLLALLTAGIPAGAGVSPSMAVMAKDHHKDKKDSGESGDHDRGHGNDPDGVDEDNPGKGKKTVVSLADYGVDVHCETDEKAGASTCTFAGVAPDGGKKIGFLQVPDDNICAEVVSSSGERADPEPHTHLSGYTSKGNTGALELVIAGTVMPSDGEATYWIKAGGDTFPANGPAIACVDAQAEEDRPTDAPTEPDSLPATGAVVVKLSTCTDVPADTSGYDWFGACETGGASVSMELAPTDASPGQPGTVDTDADGVATFTDQAPGTYTLDAVDASWCHAASDSVDADGNVVVEPGRSATVWIFMCGATDSA